MGGFALPNFRPGSSSESSLPGFPTGVDNQGRSQPQGGFSFASGGALPHQNQIWAQPTIDPGLTNQILGYLSQQVGQGLPAFNQSLYMPSSGQATQPGQLTAPLNPILQQLESFMTGKSGPESLSGVLPMWQSEMEAMQGPIDINLANLREQFGARGALGSSEMGGAVMDYMAQTSADEMALLTSATQSSLPTMLSAGEGMQQIDQSTIDRARQQFTQDLPQYNPMWSEEMSMGQMYPGTYNKPPSFGQGLLKAVTGSAGDIFKTVGSAANAAFPNLPGWASILMGA
jgi:hypothetical protein